MTTTIRRSVLVAVIVAVLWPAAAQAHVERLQIKDTGKVHPDGSATIVGTITCSPGEHWSVSVTVQQKDPATGEESFRGRGGDEGVCPFPRSPQRWSARTTDFSGTATSGVASVTVIARTFAVGNRPAPVPHGEAKRHRNVELVA